MYVSDEILNLGEELSLSADKTVYSDYEEITSKITKMLLDLPIFYFTTQKKDILMTEEEIEANLHKFAYKKFEKPYQNPITSLIIFPIFDIAVEMKAKEFAGTLPATAKRMIRQTTFKQFVKDILLPNFLFGSSNLIVKVQDKDIYLSSSEVINVVNESEGKGRLNSDFNKAYKQIFLDYVFTPLDSEIYTIPVYNPSFKDGVDFIENGGPLLLKSPALNIKDGIGYIEVYSKYSQAEEKYMDRDEVALLKISLAQLNTYIINMIDLGNHSLHLYLDDESFIELKNMNDILYLMKGLKIPFIRAFGLQRNETKESIQSGVLKFFEGPNYPTEDEMRAEELKNLNIKELMGDM